MIPTIIQIFFFKYAAAICSHGLSKAQRIDEKASPATPVPLFQIKVV
jgi:hypothetical protein